MMIKIVLLLMGLHIAMYAGFMDSVGDVVKATLSDKDDKKDISEVKTVKTVKTLMTPAKKDKDESLFERMTDDIKEKIGIEKDKSKPKDKDDSLFDSMVDSVKDTIGVAKDKPQKEHSIFSKTVTAVKEVAGSEKVEEDNAYFDDGIMADIADMIELEKGERFGLPSVFGLNKKKSKKVFGSSVLGDTFLGDIKNTSTGFYRGFKRSGQSTEFMSGVMYKSSKIYNEMFDMFDDSPLNIIDDKDKRETSVFDVFDEGNEILDIFE